MSKFNHGSLRTMAPLGLMASALGMASAKALGLVLSHRVCGLFRVHWPNMVILRYEQWWMDTMLVSWRLIDNWLLILAWWLRVVVGGPHMSTLVNRYTTGYSGVPDELMNMDLIGSPITDCNVCASTRQELACLLTGCCKASWSYLCWLSQGDPCRRPSHIGERSISRYKQLVNSCLWTTRCSFQLSPPCYLKLVREK